MGTFLGTLVCRSARYECEDVSRSTESHGCTTKIFGIPRDEKVSTDPQAGDGLHGVLVVAQTEGQSPLKVCRVEGHDGKERQEVADRRRGGTSTALAFHYTRNVERLTIPAAWR